MLIMNSLRTNQQHQNYFKQMIQEELDKRNVLDYTLFGQSNEDEMEEIEEEEDEESNHMNESIQNENQTGKRKKNQQKKDKNHQQNMSSVSIENLSENQNENSLQNSSQNSFQNIDENTEKIPKIKSDLETMEIMYNEMNDLNFRGTVAIILDILLFQNNIFDRLQGNEKNIIECFSIINEVKYFFYMKMTHILLIKMNLVLVSHIFQNSKIF